MKCIVLQDQLIFTGVAFAAEFSDPSIPEGELFPLPPAKIICDDRQHL